MPVLIPLLLVFVLEAVGITSRDDAEERMLEGTLLGVSGKVRGNPH